MSLSERLGLTWPPPLREQRTATVLVRSPRTALAMIVGIGLFSIGVGLLTLRYPPTDVLLVPRANGGMFILAGVLALFSVHGFWSSRWTGIIAGTFLSTAALLRGASIWWVTGWADTVAVITATLADPGDVSRLIGGTQWIAYGFVIFVAWPGLVHDTSVPRARR